MSYRGTFQKLRPLSLLTHLSSCYDSAHLQVFSDSVAWSLYLVQGKIIYASHSVDPFERLERHLRRLSRQIPKINSETRSQLRLRFETDPPSIQNHDYQAICWLVSQHALNPSGASVLIEGLAKEVIESFLLVKSGSYELGYQQDALPEFCRLELQTLVEHGQKRLQSWQSLAPQIRSPHQRPYFLSRTMPQQLLPDQPKLGELLKGFSFYQLGVLMNQDELQLAQSLHPYIVDGTIVLYEPYPAFAKLPNFASAHTATLDPVTNKHPKITTEQGAVQESRRLPTRLLLPIGVGITISLAALMFVNPYIQLNEIRNLKTEAKYKECITKAGTVIQSVFSKAAQGVLNECLMADAEKLAAEGKLTEAVSVAKKIPKNSPLYPKVQKRLKEWNEI